MRQDESKELFVVPIFDTEGPSYGRDDLYGEWGGLLDAMRTMISSVRASLPDSVGRPMIFSWFMLDWVGYDEDEPSFQKRKQATGYHHVLDRYRKEILTDAVLKESGDGIYWHYHHPPQDGSWGWNRDWNDSRWYENVLNEKILERNFFPSVFRAGGYVEDNETSDWLERWIPFDYSNNSPAFKKDAYDWSRAPQGWLPYHPSREDYQVPGSMNRTIARCVPVDPKGGSNTLTKNDVAEAFESAMRGQRPILSFSTHDYYGSAAQEFTFAYDLIREVAKEYPDVSWQYRNALDAVRESGGLPALPALALSAVRVGRDVLIRSNHALFCGMLYVAARFKNGQTKRLEVESTRDVMEWKCKIDSAVSRLGIGGSDAYGNTDVITVER